MTDLRAFLRRHIEAFLDHEFGPTQNMTPSGIRRILWTSDHTNRLVHHLASNWEQAAQSDDFIASHQRAMDKAFPHADPGEVAADNAQADAAAAKYDGTPEDEKPPVNPEVPW